MFSTARRCFSHQAQQHPYTVTFVGGGNGTHVGAAVSGFAPGVSARILTRRPELWSDSLSLTYPDGSVRHGAAIDAVSPDPAAVVPGAQIVLISSPVGAYADIFAKIAPHLDAGAFVGATFCQGHVGLMAQQALRNAGRQHDDITTFGMQYIPWQSKIVEAGRHGHLVGAKSVVDLATTPHSKFDAVAGALHDVLGLHCAQTPFIATALTTSNQILHPACYFGTFGREGWDGTAAWLDDPARWGPGSLYTRMSSGSAALLAQLDDELGTIRAVLAARFPLLDMSRARPCKERIRGE